MSSAPKALSSDDYAKSLAALQALKDKKLAKRAIVASTKEKAAKAQPAGKAQAKPAKKADAAAKKAHPLAPHVKVGGKKAKEHLHALTERYVAQHGPIPHATPKKAVSAKQQKRLAESVHALQKELATLKGKLAVHENHVEIGEKFNLPAQPEPKGKGGVWEDAPLSLAVSGGIALHNIGYTNKKGLQLTVDPETQRLLILNAK